MVSLNFMALIRKWVIKEESREHYEERVVPRHYRKQHKGISQPSWRQRVVVRIIENLD